PFPEKNPGMMSGTTSQSLGWTSRQVFDTPLPFGEKIRNTFSLVLLVALVICFWQPLTALYSLTKTQEHYSHIVLIPFVSLYVLYLDRKGILSSNAWSPWLGSTILGIGALWAWKADIAAYGDDLLAVQTLALVMMCWGIFLFCYGVKAFRTFSF